MTACIMDGWTRQKYWNVPSSVNVKGKESSWERRGLSQRPVGLLGVPEVVVCGTPSRLVQSTVVPTGMVMSWRTKFFISEATTWGSAVAVGVGICVGVGVAVGVAVGSRVGVGVDVGLGVSPGA